MPFHAFYNKKGNLITTFEGSMPLLKIIEVFKQSKKAVNANSFANSLFHTHAISLPSSNDFYFCHSEPKVKNLIIYTQSTCNYEEMLPSSA